MLSSYISTVSTLKSVSTQPDVVSQRFIEESNSPQTRKGRRQKLTGSEDYSDDEKLEIAITAIEAAIIHTAAMEESVLGFFTPAKDGVSKIVFEPDEYEETERLVIEVSTETRRKSIRQLEFAINKLRKGMYHAD